MADNFQTASDFPSGDIRRWVESGYQKQEIKASATTGGDVSIFRVFDAAPYQVYRVRASCKLNGASGDFRGRVKVAWWGGGTQLGERNADNSEKEGGFKVIEAGTPRLDQGTTNVRMNFRAHAHMSADAYGVAVCEWVEITRLE